MITASAPSQLRDNYNLEPMQHSNASDGVEDLLEMGQDKTHPNCGPNVWETDG